MLKYFNYAVTFAEIPNEVSLCINITKCPCHCKGCHSSYLADDIGRAFTYEALRKMIIEYRDAITCVSFMGGDAEPSVVDELAHKVKKEFHMKTAWYSGREDLSGDIHLCHFDFIKLGPYVESLGPLTSPTTNQKFYAVNKDGVFEDKTFLFWNIKKL